MALSFFLFREFFSAWQSGISPWALVLAWVVALAFGALMNGVIVARRGKEIDDQNSRRPRRAVVGIFALFLFEILIVCLFLPLDFMYQSIIAFLAAALLLDLVPPYFFHETEPRRIRTTSIAFAALLVIVLASAKWGI